MIQSKNQMEQMEIKIARNADVILYNTQYKCLNSVNTTLSYSKLKNN